MADQNPLSKATFKGTDSKTGKTIYFDFWQYDGDTYISWDESDEVRLNFKLERDPMLDALNRHIEKKFEDEEDINVVSSYLESFSIMMKKN